MYKNESIPSDSEYQRSQFDIRLSSFFFSYCEVNTVKEVNIRSHGIRPIPRDIFGCNSNDSNLSVEITFLREFHSCPGVSWAGS